MGIGYACLTVGVPDTNQKSCISKNASQEKLLDLITHNLNSLENIIDYNMRNNIRLFRISSDLIPFGSSSINQIPWWNIFASKLSTIGEKIQNNGMRVSMHPGQYTVLNSPDEGVVGKAIEDLNYHVKVLDSLGVGTEHKLVLHIGGVYSDKKQAINRFLTNYSCLDAAVKQRLVLENDDKSYTIRDVLEIGALLNTPVVFDNLHHKINFDGKQESEFFWINECRNTWKTKDGYQKIHYSQQDPLKKLGSHSNTIRINEFMQFYESLNRIDIDIMLEVKDKNLSAIKCINCTTTDSMKVLELEWAKYKYLVLEYSPSAYMEIRKLLGNKKEYPGITFYNIIEETMQKESNTGNSINAAQHVWSYFKDSASNQEKSRFLKSIYEYEQGKISIRTIKNSLRKLAIKYEQTYLLNSYYFVY